MEIHVQLKVLMLPWLGHGHVSPYLELAKKLSARNFTIYLCSTPATLDSIRSKFGEKFSKSIRLIELHLPTSRTLPARYHTTNGLPPHLMDSLKAAFDKGSASFRDILIALKPHLLIYDLLQPWAPAIAAVHKIPAVEFVSCSATMTSFMYHFYKNSSGSEFPFSSTIFYRGYESHLFDKLLEHRKDAKRVTRCIDRSSRILLIKSSREIEGKYMNYLSRLTGKKVVPVGPLVQNSNLVADLDGEQYEIMEWLNKKQKGSTIFVSFGSEYFLGKEDIEEIARGLELSDVNFIWVIRFPKGSENEKAGLEKVLPNGFFKRVGSRGKVVKGWAPQAQILVHPNTGGFVSHCGWNSVMESLKFGLPIIAMPMHLDQPLNSRLLEEVGVGVEVVRDSDGRLRAQEMAEIINKVVKGESGEAVRRKAKELQANMELRGDEEVDEAVMELSRLIWDNYFYGHAF